MKVLLVIPPSTARAKRTPDLGLGYLAACLRAAGHEADILDAFLQRLDAAASARAIRDSGAELVGVKVYSLDVPAVQQLLALLQTEAPEIPVVIGGPHPSCEQPEALFEQFPSLHYAVAGEGEQSIVTLADLLSGSEVDYAAVPGLIWRGTAGQVHANAKMLTQDLDALPLPAWDLIDPRRYPSGYSYLTVALPAAPMILTRGCPFRCTFCASHLITGRKVRKRSIDNIIEEMRLLSTRYGVRTIDVVDENVAFDRVWFLELCERIAAANLGLKWNCPYGVRLDSLDEAMVRAMERAGCTGLSLGIESGSNRILKQIKKSLTVERATEQVWLLRRCSSIVLQGFFMLGFPGETREEMEQTIALARVLPLDLAIFSVWWPAPGTELYADLCRDNEGTAPRHAAGLGQDYCARSYGTVTDAALKAMHRKAYRQFYLRPRTLLTMLRMLGSWSQVKIVAGAFLRLWLGSRGRAGDG